MGVHSNKARSVNKGMGVSLKPKNRPKVAGSVRRLQPDCWLGPVHKNLMMTALFGFPCFCLTPPSIDLKKPMIGAIFADSELYRARALGATTLVCGAFFVRVNPHVNVAAVKHYADKLSPRLLLRRWL